MSTVPLCKFLSTYTEADHFSENPIISSCIKSLAMILFRFLYNGGKKTYSNSLELSDHMLISETKIDKRGKATKICFASYFTFLSFYRKHK